MVREDEIDLRPYFLSALRHWKLVIGLAVVAAGIAAAISLAVPVGYEATSTVVIAAPGAQPVPAAKAYLDLATSEKVAAELARDVAGISGTPPSAADLRAGMKAFQGVDASSIVLKIRDAEPERASSLANAWAATFVRVSSSTFNSQEETLKQLETQLAFAQEQLRQAEAELTSLERRDSVTLLQTQLSTQQEHLTGLNKTRTALQTMAGQATSLRSRLDQLDPGANSSPRDDVALLQLQVVLLGVPAQIQFADALGTPGRTVAEQLAYVDSLASLISDRSRETDEQIAAAQPLVLDLQGRLQQSLDDQVRVNGERDIARHNVRDLAQKAAQARLAAQTGTNEPRVTDETTPPVPLPRGTTRNVATGAALGLALGFAAALGVEYLQSRQRESLVEASLSPQR